MFTQPDVEATIDQKVGYLIEFPVGDWSADGHGRCDRYTVISQKPVQDIREAHFKASAILGFEIGDICREYEDNGLDDEVVAKLDELGYAPKNTTFDPEFLMSDDVVDVWVFLLNAVDSTLELERVKPSKVSFYGYDDQGRHLQVPGYGTFSL